MADSDVEEQNSEDSPPTGGHSPEEAQVGTSDGDGDSS